MGKIQLKRREKIEYYGEMLTITEIAEKEGLLSRQALRAEYENTADIYGAVRLLKSRKTGTRQKIEYKGESHTINSIAKLEGLRWVSLKRNYEKYGDIEKAVAETKESQRQKSGTIMHHGKPKTLNAIAKSEGLSRNVLKHYYERYGSIDKAIMMAKVQQRKRQTGLVHEKKEKNREVKKREKTIILENGQSLRDYCYENSINYRCIYYLIVTYGKTFEEAIEHYKKNGQTIPKTWVFKKYGVLLRHLLLEENIPINEITKYMREGNITIGEALEKYIIRKNAKKDNLDQDWLEELYSVFTDENMTDEYDEFKKGLYVDDKEETCIVKSLDDIQRLQRKGDLFEVKQSLKEGVFTPEEERELLRQYNIKPEEIEFMFIDLYSRFDHGVLRGEEQEEQLRINMINDIIRRWPNLSEEEKIDIIKGNKITKEEFRKIQVTSEQIQKYKAMIELNKGEKQPNRRTDEDWER